MAKTTVDWEYTLTQKDIDKANNINDNMIDLVGTNLDDELGEHKAEKGGKTPPPPGGTPPPPPPKTKPGSKIKPGKKSTPKGPTKPSRSSMKGPKSRKSSRCRGIEDMFKGKYTFKDPTYWVDTGNKRPTWDVIRTSPKWAEFKIVKDSLKKKWSRLSNEEISDTERGYLIADEIDMDDYVAGRDKYFTKIAVPEKELVELNIILALDASGSTGADKQYPMSGITFAVKRAFEEMNVRHSLMVYDGAVAVVDVDQVGLSSNAWPLMGDYCGGGANNEGMVLDIAQEIVRKNGDYKNVVILISDGGVADVRKKIESIHKQSKGELSVYCLGYGDGYDEMYAGKIFGTDFTGKADKPKDFSELLIRVLEKEFAKALIKDAQ